MGWRAVVGHGLQRPRQLAASIRVVNAPNEQGQARALAPSRSAGCVAAVVVRGEADADLYRKLADQPLGDDLSLVLVQVASENAWRWVLWASTRS